MNPKVFEAIEARAMQTLNWPNTPLDEGVVRESVLNDAHLALWLKGELTDGFQYWERISTASRDEVKMETSICVATAVARPMRQQILGRMTKLLRRWGRNEAGDSWVLPTGDQTEPCGPKETDLILVWSEDESASLDETVIKVHWPNAQHVRRIGRNLFVARGVRLLRAEESLDDAIPPGTAEQLLVVAEQSGELREKSAALTDLGVLSFNAGDFGRAVEQLSAALETVQRLGDQSQECDVLGNLGMAVLASRDGQRATELFKRELALARSSGDRFAEKLALEHIAILCALGHKFADSISFYDQAIYLARDCADRRHEIRLLWRLGIQYAVAGQAGEAISRCELAVNLMRKAGNPNAAWFADNLSKFRLDPAANGLTAAEALAGGLSGRESNVLGAEGSGLQDSSPVSAASGAGLLRMALTATNAMTKFVGTGFKKVSKDVHQTRIGICTTCDHHTGIRCRACGCFTNAKAWLPHENCPLKKWPDLVEVK